MPTYLTNLAFPNRRADLSGGQGTQYVIGYEANGGPNQQWTNVPSPGLPGTATTRIQCANPAVTVGVDLASSETVWGGGPNNDFVITFVNNGIMIRLANTELYWTLESDRRSAQVIVMPRAGQAGGPANENSQIWTLTEV